MYKKLEAKLLAFADERDGRAWAAEDAARWLIEDLAYGAGTKRVTPYHLVALCIVAKGSTFRSGSLLMRCIMKVAAGLQEEPFPYVQIERVAEGESAACFTIADLGMDDHGNSVLITTNEIPASRIPTGLVHIDRVAETVREGINQYLTDQDRFRWLAEPAPVLPSRYGKRERARIWESEQVSGEGD